MVYFSEKETVAASSAINKTDQFEAFFLGTPGFRPYDRYGKREEEEREEEIKKGERNPPVIDEERT